jgi:hypothetical protein
MALTKYIFPILLAALFLASVASAAEEDYEEETTSSTSDPFELRVCTIHYPGLKKMQLYIKNFFSGRKISVKRFDRDDNDARWLIQPVVVGGKKYFEIKNKQTKTAIGIKGDSLNGNFGLYSKTGSLQTLWELNPAKPSNKVTIKNAGNGKYLLPSRNDGSPAKFGSSATPWSITCD